MTIKRLTQSDAEFIAHRLAFETMNIEGEPIPPFSSRDSKKFDSCLNEPFVTFDNKYLHHTFIERAAVLFYLIAKNHCFENGNKRIAVTMTIVFFYINKRWLNIEPVELYKIAYEVAESDRDDMDRQIGILKRVFKMFQERLPIA